MKPKNNSIKILDCTLRDGGYVNNWAFSDESIINIIKSLTYAGIDIIECGFVSKKSGKINNSSNFNDIYLVNDILRKIGPDMTKHEFCVMINQGEYNLTELPKFLHGESFVSGIRFAFHKDRWKEAFGQSKVIIEKGYKLFVQPMVTLSYSDSEILEMIKEFNSLHLYAFYIVDSFGSMLGNDFKRLHYLFENNLKPGVMLGYHSHNNLQLAYSNAIDFLETKEVNRNIVIDSSIQGMGRGAGNLNTELFADFLNKKLHTKYNIIPILETIDNYLEGIYQENYWGYSIAHFLSASFATHPNYSSFLVNKKNLSIVDMQKLLSSLDDDKKKNYSEEYITNLYIDYKSGSELMESFPQLFFTGQEILILAPGPNAIIQKNRIERQIAKNKPTIIAVNHVPSHFQPDYFFFSNQRRFDRFSIDLLNSQLIITNNIKPGTFKNQYMVVDYQRLAMMSSNKNDNVTILLLNLLLQQKVKHIYIAGLDGYKYDSGNYDYEEYNRVVDKKGLIDHNKNISISLTEIRKKMQLEFITDTMFA